MAAVTQRRRQLEYQDLCSQVYQAFGSLADAAGVFYLKETQKVLDNLSAGVGNERLPHKNLLPYNPTVRLAKRRTHGK